MHVVIENETNHSKGLERGGRADKKFMPIRIWKGEDVVYLDTG